MFIELNFKSTIPIYEQLKNEIIIGIAKGEISFGERLPSVRQLAGDIGINMHTVNKAYKQLEEEGFVSIHRQKGVVVNSEGPPIADKQYRLNLKTILKPMIANAFCRDIEQEEFVKIIEQIYVELEGRKNE